MHWFLISHWHWHHSRPWHYYLKPQFPRELHVTLLSVMSFVLVFFSIRYIYNSFTWSLPCSRACISFSETCFIKSRLDSESESHSVLVLLSYCIQANFVFSHTSCIRTFAHVFPSAFIPFLHALTPLFLLFLSYLFFKNLVFLRSLAFKNPHT